MKTVFFGSVAFIAITVAAVFGAAMFSQPATAQAEQAVTEADCRLRIEALVPTDNPLAYRYSQFSYQVCRNVSDVNGIFQAQKVIQTYMRKDITDGELTNQIKVAMAQPSELIGFNPKTLQPAKAEVVAEPAALIVPVSAPAVPEPADPMPAAPVAVESAPVPDATPVRQEVFGPNLPEGGLPDPVVSEAPMALENPVAERSISTATPVRTIKVNPDGTLGTPQAETPVPVTEAIPAPAGAETATAFSPEPVQTGTPFEAVLEKNNADIGSWLANKAAQAR